MIENLRIFHIKVIFSNFVLNFFSWKNEADERAYHKSCFRCKECNNVLSLGNFAALEGVYYCKVTRSPCSSFVRCCFLFAMC